MSVTKEQIYERTLRTYGIESQVTMVFEEMSELQKELCKWLRGKESITSIAEEIADVRIMLEQMELYFNIKGAVEKEKTKKLSRLMQRVYGTDVETVET